MTEFKKNCRFCELSNYDEDTQEIYCVKRRIRITVPHWGPHHCMHYELADEFKMTKEITCKECNHYKYTTNTTGKCNKRDTVLFFPLRNHKCTDFEKKSTGEPTGQYINVTWSSPTGSHVGVVHEGLHGYSNPNVYPKEATSSVVEQLNEKTKKNKFEAEPHKVHTIKELKPPIKRGDRVVIGENGTVQPAPTTIVGMETEWAGISDHSVYTRDFSVNVDGDVNIKGNLNIEGEIKMNENIETSIEEKQKKIKGLVEKRNVYIKNWVDKFSDLSEEVIYKYIIKYRWIRPDFSDYVVKRVNKKNRKTIKKGLKYIQIDSEKISYGKTGKKMEAQLLGGEVWNFVKKILSIISKYSTMYANEKLKSKYSKLSNQYDALLWDKDISICESCGTENNFIAIYCNSCGKKV